MRKPLQELDEGVQAIRNGFARRQGHITIPYKVIGRGEILFRNTGDVTFLIETANNSMETSSTKDSSFLQKFGFNLSRWMNRLVSTSFNMPMLQELRGELGNIRFYHVLNPAIPSRGKPLPHWDYIADTEDFIDPKTMAAYAFSQQLTLDGFTGLKRCKLKSCKKFFIGRPNTKWCKDSCGSLYRVQQMRKLNRR